MLGRNVFSAASSALGRPTAVHKLAAAAGFARPPGACRGANVPRFLSAAGGKNIHKNRSNGEGKGVTTLRFCWGSYDLEEEGGADSEELLKFQKPPTIVEIQKKLQRDVGMDPSILEYYKDGEWLRLTKPMEQLVGSSPRKPIFIRSPENFDEEEYEEELLLEDEDEDEFTNQYNDYDQSEGILKDKILDLVLDLKNTGATPLEVDGMSMLKLGDGRKTETKKYVLDLAEEDSMLQDVLLNNIGSLDHIVQCIHYGFVWKLAEEMTDNGVQVIEA